MIARLDTHSNTFIEEENICQKTQRKKFSSFFTLTAHQEHFQVRICHNLNSECWEKVFAFFREYNIFTLQKCKKANRFKMEEKINVNVKSLKQSPLL